VHKVSSSRVQSAVISFATLALIEPKDSVDVRAKKRVGGTWKRRQSFTLGHSAITDSHDGARVGRERRSAPIFSCPCMNSPWRIQGVSEATSMVMRKRMRQQTMGLVSLAMFFIQDRAEVLSDQILKTWPPVGAITVVAQARDRKTLLTMLMRSKGLMWRPSHPGHSSYLPLVKAFMWKPAATISGWVTCHTVFHWTE
jgi:hypothetical protein